MTYRPAAFLFFVLLNSLILWPATAAEFKIATLSPDGSYWMQKLREGAENVARQTDNRVRFKFYPGGVMGDSAAIFPKIQFGQLHGAALTNGSLSTLYPDIQLYNLLLKFRSLDEIDYVRERMDTELIRGLEEKGLVSLGFSEIGFAYLMSKKPIANIGDLRRQKVWVPENNAIALSAFEALAVTPIPLPIRDVLVGLQTGMVDVVTGSPVGALALQWHTQIAYVSDLPLSYIFGVFFIDAKAFSRLTPDDQVIVRREMGRVVREADKHDREDNIKALAALNQQGIEFIKPEEAAAEELRRSVDAANRKLLDSGRLSSDKIQRLDQLLAEFASR